jgi:hypothetical protein
MDILSKGVTLQNTKTLTFSCIHPMCMEGGWAISSIDDDHMTGIPHKGQPIHKALAWLAKTSTLVLKFHSELDPSTGINNNRTVQPTGLLLGFRS